MRSSLLLAPVALLALTCGCSKEEPKSTPGGGTPSAPAAGKNGAKHLEEANAAFEKQEWKKASASFEAALADASLSNDEKAAAWLDKVTADASGDGDAAGKATVAKLVKSGVTFTADQLAGRALELAKSEHAGAALDLVAFALEKFGSDAAVKKKLNKVMKECEKAFKSAGASDGLDALKRLGYTGGDSDDEAAEEPTKSGQ